MEHIIFGVDNRVDTLFRPLVQQASANSFASGLSTSFRHNREFVEDVKRSISNAGGSSVGGGSVVYSTAAGGGGGGSVASSFREDSPTLLLQNNNNNNSLLLNQQSVILEQGFAEVERELERLRRGEDGNRLGNHDHLHHLHHHHHHYTSSSSPSSIRENFVGSGESPRIAAMQQFLDTQDRTIDYLRLQALELEERSRREEETLVRLANSPLRPSSLTSSPFTTQPLPTTTTTSSSFIPSSLFSLYPTSSSSSSFLYFDKFDNEPIPASVALILRLRNQKAMTRVFSLWVLWVKRRRRRILGNTDARFLLRTTIRAWAVAARNLNLKKCVKICQRLEAEREEMLKLLEDANRGIEELSNQVKSGEEAMQQQLPLLLFGEQIMNEIRVAEQQRQRVVTSVASVF